MLPGPILSCELGLLVVVPMGVVWEGPPRGLPGLSRVGHTEVPRD